MCSWHLLLFSFISSRYLVTEGQIIELFLLTFFAMVTIMVYKRHKGLSPDPNGLFLLYNLAVTLFLVVIWMVYLWNDTVLREKYPGLLYVPEPWSYYTLYIKKNHWITSVQVCIYRENISECQQQSIKLIHWAVVIVTTSVLSLGGENVRPFYCCAWL